MPGDPGSAHRKHGRAWLAVAAGIVVLACLAGVGYALLSGHHHTTAKPPARPASTPPTLTATNRPAHIVQAYFRAINQHRYVRAWRLGGKNTGMTYQSFVAGFAGTEHDSVRVISTSGQVVTARLVALQTDGTVKTFQGTYTISRGAIAESDIHPTS